MGGAVLPFAEPRRWLNSGGLGTMGVGLPYAMGAQFANPDATVAVVTGEGSIQMCIQELSTAKQFRLPLKIISLNNRYLGMVRQWQEMFTKPLLGFLYGFAAGFRETGRGLWPRRHPRRRPKMWARTQEGLHRPQG